MDSSPASRWISFLERDLLDDDPPHTDSTLFWNASAENENPKADSFSKDNPNKRSRDDCSSGACAKACREKMRRDRLNDRFMELSAVLEPDKPPKTDKASILRDAARILSQLRAESQQLKDANHQLQETIRELKVEKNELRDEKLSLKCEKERLEKQLKSVNILPGYVAHPAAVHAAVAAYPSQNQSRFTKSTSFPEMPFQITMAQWMPPATVDISNDHVLRPPVA